VWLVQWPTAGEIAQQLKAKDKDLVYRFLRLLSSIGVFEEHAGRRFGHSPMSLLLRKDHPQNVR
jgi:Fe2+ or Zn2+ uptake regulation protein